jgi:hypothetical protein
MSSNIVNVLTKSQIFPVVEFSLIITMVIVTYWGMDMGGFSRLKPATKFSVSMFLGSLGYMAGKMAVIALFASKITPPTAYAF